MSLWTQMFAASNPTTFDPNGVLMGMLGPVTAAGVPVSADSSLKLSTVFACVRLLSETIASLPLVVYQRQADGGRAEATNHPLFDLLHDRPNSQQTAIEFRQMMTAQALLRGNAYARIVPGARGFVDQLLPMHPDTVAPEELPDGNLRYRVGGKVYNDDQVLHLKGMSFDGKLGVSVITYARESMGLNFAAQTYGARFFGNGARPSGVLKKTDGKGLSPEAAKRLRESWTETHGGQNQHRVAVLEEGLEWQSTGLDNTDAQFLELLDHQAEDECRWFGVPPHMVGLKNVSSWGSGIEQLGIAFVTYTLLPWLKRWEQAISRDLILAPQSYFVEHVVAGLLRGDTPARYGAYAIGKQNGWLSPNEIRRLENMNPRDGGDQYDTVASGQAAPALAQEDSSAKMFVTDAAARVVRKEIAAVGRIAKRVGPDSVAWGQGVQDFYAEHADFVMQTMRLQAEAVRAYISGQVAELLERGPGAMDDWETRRVADLAALVLEAQ